MNRRRVDVIDPKPLFDARVGGTCAYIYSSTNVKILFQQHRHRPDIGQVGIHGKVMEVGPDFSPAIATR